MSGLMPRVDSPGETSRRRCRCRRSRSSRGALAPAQPPGDSFAIDARQDGLGRERASRIIAAQAVSALQSGQNVPLHQAVIAMEEANVSFQLMVEVRNRLLDAYQEIMRMQV